MEIDDSILQMTTKCNENFACLKNLDFHCLKTEVFSRGDGRILFINCPENLCQYSSTFGNATTCSCPTRVAIFNKYKK